MIHLYYARNIKRTAQGRPTSWTSEELIERFATFEEFSDYLKSSEVDLTRIVAFSGSAYSMARGNEHIAARIRLKGLLSHV